MEAIKNNILSYEVGSDGIAIITINMVDYPANLFSFDFIESYIETAQDALKDEQVKGVIVTSSRRMFMAGADLSALKKPVTDKEAMFKGMLEMHAGFRQLETGGKPFVAAINGTALGGGLELALTCHHRICVNDPRIKIGFPEAKVGLFPGGGGTIKAPYLMGIQAALMNLTQGKEMNPQAAMGVNLVNELVDSPDDLIPAAKKWIAANPKPVQPWDNRKHRIPGGGLMTPNGAQTMMGSIGNLRKMTHGNYPGVNAILKVLHDGLQMTFDRALEVEARYFVNVLSTPEARNQIRTGFFAIQEAAKGKGKPAGYDKYEVKKLGVLGAGMMGAGIAFVSARAGMEVVLKDVSKEGAEKGKSYSEMLMKKRISKGRSTEADMQALLDRIHPTDDPAAVEGCDYIIEAVFENPDLKATVTKQTEAVLGKDKIYGSNTSTIPITLLAKASERPENFIGIHFFSPVDKMPLVEIIVGEKTNDRAIAATIDYVMAIRKVPIVVNDSRGFFTSRCFGTFTSEGIYLLEEGVPAAMIENLAKNQGMPVGPLAVQDEVSLTLALHVMESDPGLQDNPEMKRLYGIYKKFVEEYKRPGKKGGAGFYEYPQGGKKFLWPELGKIYNSDLDTLNRDIVEKRIMHRQALESWRCLEEGVLRSAKDGDIGSVMGWGFPIYTGGALSYIDYVGAKQFVADCDDFAARFGARWKVSDDLRALAESGKSVHDYKKA